MSVQVWTFFPKVFPTFPLSPILILTIYKRYICMYAYVYVCMCISIYVYVRVYLYVCIYVYERAHVRVYRYVHVWICNRLGARTHNHGIALKTVSPLLSPKYSGGHVMIE